MQERVHVLTNPKKAAIRREFETFSKNLTDQDSFLFYFSGHGTQIIDKFAHAPGDEAKGRHPDKNDEALLPVDVNLSLPETYLLDDELNSLLQAFKTRKITCIIDTCYAGDALKNMELGQTKGVPLPSASAGSLQQAGTSGRVGEILDDAAEFAILLAAAPYNKAIYELRIPVQKNYLPISAMTYSLYRQVFAARSVGLTGAQNLTYRQLVARLQRDHQQWNLPWQPVLEGAESRFDEYFLQGTSVHRSDNTLSLETIDRRLTRLSTDQLISVKWSLASSRSRGIGTY
jgi:hypothetical protein